MPSQAYRAARRLLDEDDDFRTRVRDGVDPDEVGRAGWLLLDRPDGWEVELAALREAAPASGPEPGVDRELRRARHAVERAEEDVARARRDAETAERSLSAEREARKALERRAGDLVEELARVRADRDDAVRSLKATEARAAVWLRQRREAEAQRDALLAAGVHDADARATEPGVPADGAARPASQADDAAAVHLAVRLAAEAAETLSASLAQAVALLEGEGSSTGTGSSVVAPGPSSEDPSGRSPRRRPTPLPVGVFDDGTEAAVHLLRVPGMHLLVDGYNVSMAGWPTLPIDLQRQRLVDALRQVEARFGVRVIVVFDGDGSGPGLAAGSVPRSVQVRFSPEGIEADDVLIAMVGELPPDVPVVVASSDRRVGDGVRARGANVLTSTQLLAV